MAKVKVRQSILKRFKITKTGKILRLRQGIRHRHAHKSKKRLRRFAEPATLSHGAAKAIKKLLGVTG